MISGVLQWTDIIIMCFNLNKNALEDIGFGVHLKKMMGLNGTTS